MAEKPGHLGIWWCACGRTEPRPRLTAEEEARLAWWQKNGRPATTCGCPTTHDSHGGCSKKEHAAECLAKAAEMLGLREEWGVDALWARSHGDATRTCPGCGASMVQARVPGSAGFAN